MEMFDFSELDLLMNELDTLEKQGMQLNAIGSAIKEGNINRELVELSLAIDPDFIDTNYYPVNSFSKDISCVNQEVLMKGWITNTVKSVFNMSNISLRATVIITAAILWLISKLRKKINGSSGGSDSKSSGGSGGSSSGGNGGNTLAPIDLTKPLKPFPRYVSKEIQEELDELYTKKAPNFKIREFKPKYDDIIQDVKKLLSLANPLISKLSTVDKVMDFIGEDFDNPTLNNMLGLVCDSSVNKMDVTNHPVSPNQVKYLISQINMLDECLVDDGNKENIGKVFSDILNLTFAEGPLYRFCTHNHGMYVHSPEDAGGNGRITTGKAVLGDIRVDYIPQSAAGLGHTYRTIYENLNQFGKKRVLPKLVNGKPHRLDVRTDWSLLVRPIRISYKLPRKDRIKLYGLTDNTLVNYQFAALDPIVSKQLEALERTAERVKVSAETALAKNALGNINTKYSYETFSIGSVKRSTSNNARIGDGENYMYPLFEMLLEYNNYSCGIAANMLKDGIVGVSQRVIKDINTELILGEAVYRIREKVVD